MNCKPGDLAIVIRGEKSSGRIVRCLELLPAETFIVSKCGKTGALEKQSWKIEGWVFYSTSLGVLEFAVCHDHHLRPIKNPDEDAQDESTAWLPPVPTKEHA